MTNEEKARKLARDYFRRGQLGLTSPDSESAGYECSLEMALWKDEQYKIKIDALINFIKGCCSEHPILRNMLQVSGFDKVDDFIEEFKKIISSNIDGTFESENIESCLDLKNKWKPEHEHIMFYIDRNLVVTWMVYNMFKDDCLKLVRVGNCFETREEALTVREKIKRLLNISNK